MPIDTRMLWSAHTACRFAYESEKKTTLIDWHDVKSAAACFPRFCTISGSKMPYAKTYRHPDTKPRGKPSAVNEKSEVKQCTRAIMDSKKKANSCFKCGDKRTPEHRDLCKVHNNGTAKLIMIIELFDDDELLDASKFLDVSHNEIEGAHESKEALDSGATKGAHFPFDLGGIIELDMHTSNTHRVQPSWGIRGRMLRASFVEHCAAMPFHAWNDADGNAPMGLLGCSANITCHFT